MTVRKEASVHYHAAERSLERIGKSEIWLLEQIDEQKTLRLPGKGRSQSGTKVRSGHLLYVPESSKFFVLVIDDRKRLVITVLNEEMAVNSDWGEELSIKSKLKAIRAAGERVPDGAFIQEFAAQRGGAPVTVRIRSLDIEWKPKMVNLQKLMLEPDRINTECNEVQLTPEEVDETRSAIRKLISEQVIRPFGDVFLTTGRGKTMRVKAAEFGIGSLGDAEMARRWV